MYTLKWLSYDTLTFLLQYRVLIVIFFSVFHGPAGATTIKYTTPLSCISESESDSQLYIGFEFCKVKTLRYLCRAPKAKHMHKQKHGATSEEKQSGNKGGRETKFPSWECGEHEVM